MTRRAAALAVALCALLAGCSVGYTGGGTTASPEPDRVGWEDGYRANETLNVTTADGIDERELDAIVARTTARVEVLRGAEFDGNVTVELLTREEYLARNLSFTPAVDRATDQRWEAAFMIGEETESSRAIDVLFGGAVAGYYLPGGNEIGIVVPDDGGIDTRTLAHELVHALQHQRGWDVPARSTLDGRLAGQGLTEGEAVAVEQEYAARCGDEWDCLSRAQAEADNVSAIAAYQGLYLTYRAPYVVGPTFIATLRDRGGWSAVADAYERPPETTRELLDLKTYPVGAQSLAVEDRSNGDWERYDDADSLGRTTVHSAFWTNGLVSRDDDAIETDYDDPYSDGLVADRFVPYRNGPADGYVWRLRFANASEAAEFADGYDRLLRLRLNADRVGEGVYVVEDGPFADAFRLVVDGETVTVVNGPSVDDLDEIHG